MLTKQEALQLVTDRLRQESPPDNPSVVADGDTIEKPYGWVFFYNSKKFVDMGVFKYRLAGNGPVIVNKCDGTVEFFGTNKPPLELVVEYEQKRGL